jgi:uncharacterized membrane protein
MFWCWVQAVLVEGVIAIGFIVAVVALCAILAGLAWVKDHVVPEIVKTATKYTFRTIVCILVLLLLGFATIRAKESVCARGFVGAVESAF